MRFSLQAICLAAFGTLAALVPQPLAAADVHDYVAVGNALDQQKASTSIFLVDEAVNRRVSEIGQRVARQSGHPEFSFTFRVINDAQVNAYATSGGFIYINTGLLDFVQSEPELAAVIAHEVTHIVEHHLFEQHNEEVKKAISAEVESLFVQALFAGAAGAAGGASGSPGQFDQIGGQLSSIASAYIDTAAETAILGYKRDLETEADRCAVKFLIDAKYDPRAFVSVLTRMQSLKDHMIAEHRALTFGLLNKQPGLEERIRLINSTIDELQKQNALPK